MQGDSRTAVDAARDAALRSVRTQAEKATSDFLQKRISVGNQCANIESLQVCWGTAQLKPDTNPPHMRGFRFTFERPFRQAPSIANGINVEGETGQIGHALGVSKWVTTRSEYKGRLNNMHGGKSIEGIVTMQYVAVGPAK